MLYGYCIRLDSDPPPDEGVSGIRGTRVIAQRCGDLAVWVSELDEPAEVSEAGLREHERVVREAMRTATPLPLRFGSIFRSIGALEEAIDSRRDVFRQKLSQVAGHAEVLLRVERRADDGPQSLPQTPPRDGNQDATAPGREYLQRRRAEFESRESKKLQAEQILREIEGDVSRFASATAVSIDREGRFIGRVACLVRRGDLSAFRQHIAVTLQGSRPEVRISATGPWAPYSFANE